MVVGHGIVAVAVAVAGAGAGAVAEVGVVAVEVGVCSVAAAERQLSGGMGVFEVATGGGSSMLDEACLEGMSLVSSGTGRRRRSGPASKTTSTPLTSGLSRAETSLRSSSSRRRRRT